jgi:hypothetical protein
VVDAQSTQSHPPIPKNPGNKAVHRIQDPVTRRKALNRIPPDRHQAKAIQTHQVAAGAIQQVHQTRRAIPISQTRRTYGS